jgi:ubiquinone/menaquinone biosynthesis C-methylase UbiE
MNAPQPSIPPEEYTPEYYQSCEGYSEFHASQGRRLPERLRIPLDAARIRAGMRVVDIGCGRGEILVHAALAGAVTWGLDYARAAVEIARRTLNETLPEIAHGAAGVQQSTALALPFPGDSIDRVFMLDVVEHLAPAELRAALGEVFRILKPGGRLVIHTMPNLWYYRHGYAWYRRVQGLRGHSLPADPRQRWKYIHTHVNEQTPLSLYQSVRSAGFQTSIWLQNTQAFDRETSRLVRFAMTFLVSVYPFRLWFCNDIFALAVRPAHNAGALEQR